MMPVAETWRRRFEAPDVFSRRRNLLFALLFSMIPWIWFGFLLLKAQPAHWPWHGPTIVVQGRTFALATSKWDIGLFIWIVEFLLIKSYLMWARARVQTWLGTAMIAVNLAFALAYYLALITVFWPTYAHLNWIRFGIRGVLAVAVTWATIRLMMSVDPAVRGPRSPWELIALLQQETAFDRQQIATLYRQLEVAKAENALLMGQTGLMEHMGSA